jgi:hypothetical protein
MAHFEHLEAELLSRARKVAADCERLADNLRALALTKHGGQLPSDDQRTLDKAKSNGSVARRVVEAIEAGSPINLPMLEDWARMLETD